MPNHGHFHGNSRRTKMEPREFSWNHVVTTRILVVAKIRGLKKTCQKPNGYDTLFPREFSWNQTGTTNFLVEPNGNHEISRGDLSPNSYKMTPETERGPPRGQCPSPCLDVESYGMNMYIYKCTHANGDISMHMHISALT